MIDKIAESNGDYVVLCPHCKRENEVSSDDEGEVFFCLYNACGKRFIVGEY